MNPLLHYFLHYGSPFIIGYILFRKEWLKVSLLLLATNLVDLDHLLADPIFDPKRCSINFHPLHSYYAIGVYVLMLLLPQTWKLIGLGLLMHMAVDGLDCLF